MNEAIQLHRLEQPDARRLIEQLRALLSVERDANAEQLTLRKVYSDWLERRRKRGLRNTINERAQLENHVLPRIGSLPLDEIRVRHIRELVDKLRASKLAPRTVRSIYGTVHKLFADLVVDEILASTPCVLTRDQLPKLRDKDPEWRIGALFLRQELEVLISTDVIAPERRVLNAIKFLTGARIGEAVGLRWRDLDEASFPLMRLAIARSYDQPTKTDLPRLVPVHPTLAKILMQWKKSGFAAFMGRAPTRDDLIVPWFDGRIRSRHKHRKLFRDELEQLGLRARRVHDTRRTFITLARVDGARREVLEQITHAPKRSVMDLYTTLPWTTLCEAVRCIRVRLCGPRETRARLAALRGGRASDEKKAAEKAT